jgi:hypothetical protein
MKTSLLIITICLSLLSCSIFKFAKKPNIEEMSFQKANYLEETHPISQWLKDFEPTKTVIIGPEREYKSLYEFFNKNYKISNVYVLVEEGSYYSDDEIWVDGQNIVIEGVGKVHQYCNKLYSSVMVIVGTNVMVKNLHMQHAQPGNGEYQNCSGRVIMFDNAHFCVIDGCDLNGCGLAGLHDNLGNSDILVRNCYIHNNSLGAYTDIDGNVWQDAIDDHPVFKFEKNKITNNGPDRVPEK